MSRKKTKRAERTKPTPMLKSTRQQMGYRSRMNFQVKIMLSARQNTKKILSVSKKLINVWIFFEKRNRYFGTLTLVKIAALPIKDSIPCVLDSLK